MEVFMQQSFVLMNFLPKRILFDQSLVPGGVLLSPRLRCPVFCEVVAWL
jgi:hypothetical protein